MARKIADHKMTAERQEALTTLANMGFMPMHQATHMAIHNRLDVQLVLDAIARSDNPAYFEQRFEFNN
jgi:hypothetical protein